MRDTGKITKTDFLKQPNFQLAEPYVKSRKLTGETKLLAKKMGFIDAPSNTLNHIIIQAIK